MQVKNITAESLTIVIPLKLANSLTPDQLINERIAIARLFLVTRGGNHYAGTLITNQYLIDNKIGENLTYLKDDPPINKILSVYKLTNNLYTALHPYIEHRNETAHSPNQTIEHT